MNQNQNQKSNFQNFLLLMQRIFLCIEQNCTAQTRYIEDKVKVTSEHQNHQCVELSELQDSLRECE